MPKKKSTPIVEEPSYEVECIYAARVTDDAQWEYNIKWGGYSEEENSWEPESNLNGCARMMAEFWEQVGIVKERIQVLPEGHEVTPSDLWMRRQKESYQKSQEKQSQKKNKLKSLKYKGTGLRKAASHLSDDDSDEDDVPLSVKASRKVQSPTTKASSKVDNVPGSFSKRKRDDDLSPGPPTKRPKASIVDGPSATSVPANIAASNKNNEGEPPRSASPDDSLFGDGSDSDKSTPPPRPAGHQLPQPLHLKPDGRSSMSVEIPVKSKSKVPLHVQRRQNPLVKPMALPVLDTQMGGISTKNRILLQGSKKGGGPSTVAKISTSGSASGPPSAGTPDMPSLASTPGNDASTWLKENFTSKDHAASVISRPPSAEPTTATLAAHQLHFSKRWRWTGQLAVGDNESGFAESVGNIVLTDSTPFDRSAGKLSLEGLLPSHVDTICLRHHYPVSVLRTVLRDFKPSQFAIMAADQADDESYFADVVSYMAKHELFSQSPLLLSGDKAATMFVFPSTIPHLLDSLNVPAKVRQGRGLIVAIGYQAYAPGEGERKVTYSEDWKAGAKSDVGPEPRSLDFGAACLALDFPDSLFHRLTNKQCTIFTTPSDVDLPGRDTLALTSILGSAHGCTLVPVLTGSARFIFIHVSAWGMLHKLPGLVDRRLRRPDVHFYTYGSDPSVERERWGVHEVFPLGGVVTFTPRAIVEDPAGVEQLIKRLHEHPLWACYVLPAVIPMLSKVAAGDAEEGEYVNKSGIEALSSVLLCIERGELALTWQPPARVGHDADAEVDWLAEQARLAALRGVELVGACWTRGGGAGSERDVEAQIVRDLLGMQSALRTEFRRFVVVTDTGGPANSSKAAAASTSVRRADAKDGFELTHARDFVFGDDYFAAEGGA